MDLKEYQEEASRTDQVPDPNPHALVIPLLGLAGEAGSLLAEYKKHLRDGEAHQMFRQHISEELGDILWYVANIASKFDLDLDEIARENIWKTRDRWPVQPGAAGSNPGSLFDGDYPASEQLPRRLRIELREVSEARRNRVLLTTDGTQVADRITDNAYEDDGYRFHDVFHLAYAAVLGWSPVLRAVLKCKRKSNPIVDEVEDGGRAIVIEEALAAFIFDYAKKHDFLDGIDAVDYQLLKTVMSMTAGLEVSARSAADWERAILEGFRIWRAVRKQGGGVIEIDLDSHAIHYSNDA